MQNSRFRQYAREMDYDLDQHEEDLTLMLHAWPDMEEVILRNADADDEWEGESWRRVAHALQHAFRIEVQEKASGLCFVAIFDLDSYEARQAAAELHDVTSRIDSLASRHAPTQGSRWGIDVRVVPAGKPVEGEVCPRVMAPLPGPMQLMDIPEPEPPPSSVPYEMRGLHKLTPIEAPFYDAMRETELTFAVQPRVQGPDQMYRPDFIVYYGGRAVVVEIDGHEGHKTREQRSADSARERWFQQRTMPVVRFTGSQVWADARGCVEELLAVLRSSAARP